MEQLTIPTVCSSHGFYILSKVNNKADGFSINIGTGAISFLSYIGMCSAKDDGLLSVVD